MAYSINIIHPSIEPFTKDELDKYIGLIDGDTHINEHDLSRFFYKYPKFLTIGGYYDVAREVVIFNPLNNEIKTEFRLDFLRRRIGDIYWDIVELKSPNLPLSIKHGKHPQFQSSIQGGIEQLRDYKDFLDDNLNALNVEQAMGIKVKNPNLCLIGGRSGDNITLEQMKQLKHRYNDVRIVTYDDLVVYASDNYKEKFVAVPYQLGVNFNFSLYEEDRKLCLQNYMILGKKIKIIPLTNLITNLSRLYPDDLFPFIESFTINELVAKCYDAYSYMPICTICSKMKKSKISKTEQINWKRDFVETLDFERLATKFIFNNSVAAFRFLDELKGNEQHPISREAAIKFLLCLRPDEYAFKVEQAPDQAYRRQKMLWIIRNLLGSSHPWVKEVISLVRRNEQKEK